MVKNLLTGCALALMLGGCAMGIKPGSPSVSYTVPRDYQTVYLRAQNQAAECLRGASGYEVVARIDAATHTGEVAVQEPLAGAVMARTAIKAVDARHTEVTHTVSGHRPWDLNGLDAMRQSVLMDTSVCVAYK